MRNYRNAFLLALVGNLVFIGILATFWWRSMHHPQAAEAVQPAVTNSPPGASEPAAMAPHEAALVPVQLSPERLQSIGVRMGRVERLWRLRRR